MKSDYTTNSRYITHTIAFWKVGRIHFLSSGVKGLIGQKYSYSIIESWFLLDVWCQMPQFFPCWPCRYTPPMRIYQITQGIFSLTLASQKDSDITGDLRTIKFERHNRRIVHTRTAICHLAKMIPNHQKNMGRQSYGDMCMMQFEVMALWTPVTFVQVSSVICGELIQVRSILTGAMLLHCRHCVKSEETLAAEPWLWYSVPRCLPYKLDNDAAALQTTNSCYNMIW